MLTDVQKYNLILNIKFMEMLEFIIPQYHAVFHYDRNVRSSADLIVKRQIY